MFSLALACCLTLGGALAKYNDDYEVINGEYDEDYYYYYGEYADKYNGYDNENEDYDYYDDSYYYSYNENDEEDCPSTVIGLGNDKKRCYGWGDPHVTTFDGQYYHPQGHYNGQTHAGWYRYVATCKSTDNPLPFVVSYYYIPFNTLVAGTRGVKVTLTASGAFYSHQDGVGDKVKGVAVTIPNGHVQYYDVNGNQVSSVACTGTFLKVYAQTTTMRHVSVIVDRHVVVRASYWRYVSEVYIDPQFSGRACGLCGKFNLDNSNTEDEFELCNGELLKDATAENMRTFRHSKGLTLTETFTRSWAEEHTCSNENTIAPERGVTCTDAQKAACKTKCEAVWGESDSPCKSCNRLGTVFKNALLDACADDMIAENACQVISTGGKACTDMENMCRDRCR